MKVKEIIEIKELKSEEINLDIGNKTLSISCLDNSKQIEIFFKILANKNKLHVVFMKNNKEASLIDMESCNIDDLESTLYIKFKHIFLGSNIEEEIVNNVNKYIVKFEENIISKSKCFEDNNYKITLKNNYIEISNGLHKENNYNYRNEFLRIYELIFLFIGYFPKIKKIILHKDDYIIEEYSNLSYYYYSSKDTMNNKFSLIDINDISNENNILNLWNKLKKEVGEYPIIGMFISQMENIHYSEYKLGILLQSINGYFDRKIKSMLPGKSAKDEKIVKIITDIVNSFNEISKRDKTKICKYINNYHSLGFKDELKYLMDKGSYSKEIFWEEIYLNQNKLKDKCNSYVEKSNYLNKIVNERNLISHMNNKTIRLTNFQRRMAYYKWFLVYRIIIMEELGIKINNVKLEKCIDKIRDINRIENLEGCDVCEYKLKCIVNFNKVNR